MMGEYENALVIENMTKVYPGVRALDNVGFTVRKGEIHALVGENGAGKSTLIKILAGALQPDKGTIQINGQPVTFNHPLDALEHGIAVMYQDLSIFSNLSVAENIMISRNIESSWLIRRRNMKDKARGILAQLDIHIDLDQPLKYLSVAMQNMVAIARALANSAGILILDEPTASLSKDEVSALFGIIRMLRDQGMSIVFVSHKLDEVFAISGRTTVLRDGRLVQTFTTDVMKEAELISAMVGRNVMYERYAERAGGQAILKVEKLCKKHNFEDISFVLKKGEILGFTGLIGAGRSELARAIFGSNIPDAGSVRLYDEALDMSSTKKAVSAGIAYLPESRHTHGLFLSRSLKDNLGAVILDQIKTRFGLVDNAKKRSVAEGWIQKLSIRPPFPDMTIEQFSGGNQQKAVIAKWLAAGPKVLIVDEPTHGVDIGAKSEIHRLLRNLSEQGIGVIVISSELPEILAVCDRIVVMRMGRIVGEFRASEANQEKIMNMALKG